MKKTLFACVVVLAGLAACSSGDADETNAAAQEVAAVDCEVAIVGGGAGGLHTALRLAPTMGSKVCLFEKNDTLGGRIRDKSFDDKPDSPRVGVGARRVMGTQDVLLGLATELGIELEQPAELQDLIQARGTASFSKDDLADRVYPTIPKSTQSDKDRETLIYDLLRASPERATLPNPTKYPDFATYIRKVAGEEQLQFLRDMSRFRADFEYPLDARGYLDYLDEEWDTAGPRYPKGGMSSFIRGMEAKSTAAGARIFKGEPVASIAKDGTRYTLKTSKRIVKASKVVITVPPNALDKIQGDVVDRIRSQPQLQQIVGVKVVTVTQWWQDASWYSAINKPGATENGRVWRSWTTDHCLNFIEIPVEDYAAAQKVTRSVYVDNQKCADFWEGLSLQGTAAVEDELAKELTALFSNGVSAPATVTVPKPLKTFVQVWPDAWHYLKAGATISNAELRDWAVEPLAGEPVALVGEAYNVQRSGWSDAAYKSSLNLLAKKYGLGTAPITTKSVAASFGPRSYAGVSAH